ncbi:16S rRNA (guanine(527)-N(7))-methyltransferase RsmG [Motiliproteus coralliicola]|uniref:Ribosomal RNA small subunit methyltransferase G n=1 Tax=Motiliproteus coralliicola TaxID=2283196 RepID=A0A369WCB6_9GAMM|nr:16S rRNA (guanine(527)-N(7))-methyltransferase RsmG [Motiliproteus coralliicola]RDE18819.1 16S rRNA (guanine(527)-N(7))-methyltransferase RsmG [Motiliproteus coralliicola]
MSVTEYGLPQDCESTLIRGAQKLGVALSGQQQQLLLRYLGLLHKWNRAYNLTAIRDPLAMVSRHLLDSLSVVPEIEALQPAPQRIADVGTGPGLPGVVLAIMYPQQQFTLMDSNGKKTRFLQQAKLELGLDNIEIYHGRVEQYPISEPFDAVISRAFASLEDMLTWTAPLCDQNGYYLAMKGLYPEQELAQMPEGFVLRDSRPLQVPGSEGERHLLTVQKTQPE